MDILIKLGTNWKGMKLKFSKPEHIDIHDTRLKNSDHFNSVILYVELAIHRIHGTQHGIFIRLHRTVFLCPLELIRSIIFMFLSFSG